MRQYKSSLLSCKNRWIQWMTQENFKKWNQITVGDCLAFPVSLQWFQVLVPCWAATNACLVDTWNTSGLLEKFLVIHFPRLILPEIILEEFSPAHHKENEDQFHKLQGRGLFSQKMTNKIERQFQCRHLQDGRRLWVRWCRWDFRRILWLDSKDSKYRNCNSTNSLIPNYSWFGRYDSQIRWLLVLIFHRKQCCGSKKWRWLIPWMSLNPRDPFLERIFRILRCWTRRLLLLWTRSSRIPNSRRRSVSRNRKPRRRTSFYEEDRSPSWSTTTFEWLALMTQYWIMLVYSLVLFMMTFFRNSIRDGTKFCYRWQKIHPMKSWKVCTNWGYVSLMNSKPYGSVRHGDTSAPNYKKLKTMVKRCIDQKLRLRKFEARYGRIQSGAVVKSRKGIIGVEGGKGICFQWNGKSQCSKGDQCSFRHESNDRAQKPDHNAATLFEPSLSRGRSVSKKNSIQGNGDHGGILRQQCRYYLEGTCTRSPCEYWHPPECQFYKTETGCKAGDKFLFPHHKVDEQPNKKPKKGYYSHKRRESDDKIAVAIVKIVPQLCCVSQDSEALVFQREKVPGKPDAKKPWDRFVRYGSLNLRYVMRVSRKRKGRRWENKC